MSVILHGHSVPLNPDEFPASAVGSVQLFTSVSWSVGCFHLHCCCFLWRKWGAALDKVGLWVCCCSELSGKPEPSWWAKSLYLEGTEPSVGKPCLGERLCRAAQSFSTWEKEGQLAVGFWALPPATLISNRLYVYKRVTLRETRLIWSHRVEYRIERKSGLRFYKKRGWNILGRFSKI